MWYLAAKAKILASQHFASLHTIRFPLHSIFFQIYSSFFTRVCSRVCACKSALAHRIPSLIQSLEAASWQINQNMATRRQSEWNRMYKETRKRPKRRHCALCSLTYRKGKGTADKIDWSVVTYSRHYSCGQNQIKYCQRVKAIATQQIKPTLSCSPCLKPFLKSRNV